MKEFWKLLLKIVSYSAGVALIGSAYLFVDSIKNKPLTKEEVKEIVSTQLVPIGTLNLHIMDGLIILDSAFIRHLANEKKQNELMQFYKDQILNKPFTKPEEKPEIKDTIGKEKQKRNISIIIQKSQ